MTRIAICDDDEILCTKIEDFILEYEKTSPFAMDTEVFYSGAKLCEFCKTENEFDLIFLDIMMAEMSGIDVGRLIRKEMKNKKVPIVYISSSDGFAGDLLNIRPLYFFNKPLSYKNIKTCLDEYFEDFFDENLYFEYNVGKVSHKLAVNSILYFESNAKKVTVTTLHDSFEFYSKLSDVQRQPFAKAFLSIHKSNLVNPKQILEYHFDYLIMKNNVRLEISRSNKKEVRNRLLMSK